MPRLFHVKDPKALVVVGVTQLRRVEQIIQAGTVAFSVNIKVAIDTDYSRNLFPLGDLHQSGVSEIHWDVAVFGGHSADVRQIFTVDGFDGDGSTANPLQAIELGTHAKVEQVGYLSDHSDTGV